MEIVGLAMGVAFYLAWGAVSMRARRRSWTRLSDAQRLGLHVGTGLHPETARH